MIFRYSVALGLALSLAVGAVPVAAQNREQRQITWTELGEVIGKKVRIVMPDGVLIEGRATEVQVDALALDIRKSGDRSKYSRGKFLVPRATLRTFSIDQPRNRGKLIGVAVGGGVGAFLAALASSGYAGDYRAALIAGAVALPVGGYLLGRAADRRTITYVMTQ